MGISQRRNSWGTSKGVSSKDPRGGGRESSQTLLLRQCVRNSHRFAPILTAPSSDAIPWLLDWQAVKSRRETISPLLRLNVSSEPPASQEHLGFMPVNSSVTLCIAPFSAASAQSEPLDFEWQNARRRSGRVYPVADPSTPLLCPHLSRLGSSNSICAPLVASGGPLACLPCREVLMNWASQPTSSNDCSLPGSNWWKPLPAMCPWRSPICACATASARNRSVTRSAPV